MNKYQEYVLRYQSIHDGSEQYMTADGQLHTNIVDPTKGKVLFDGSQFGKKFPPFIRQVIYAKRRAITLLDYGCGKAIHNYIPLAVHGNRVLQSRFNGMLQCYYCYDPAVKQYSMKPPLGMVFDLTCCADVMEHVPEDFVPVVLAEIGNYTKANGAIIFSISSNPAKKMFSDGENLHTTLKPIEWWIECIQKYCGNKSFLLIHSDNAFENNSVSYYNSPNFAIWEMDAIKAEFAGDMVVEEVK